MESGLVLDVGKNALENFWRKHFAVFPDLSVICCMNAVYGMVDGYVIKSIGGREAVVIDNRLELPNVDSALSQLWVGKLRRDRSVGQWQISYWGGGLEVSLQLQARYQGYCTLPSQGSGSTICKHPLRSRPKSQTSHLHLSIDILRSKSHTDLINLQYRWRPPS